LVLLTSRPVLSGDSVPAVEAINNALVVHDVNYVVPSITPSNGSTGRQSFKIDRILNPLLLRITRCVSSAHSAFVLIGSASYFLNLAAGLHDSKADQQREMKEIARNRVRAMPIICDGVELDSDALFERLDTSNNDPLSLRQLLRKLQMPIMILFVSADPRQEDRLRLLDELRAITRTLRAVQHRDAFKLESLPSCRVRDLSAGIQEHCPTILHFSGHGTANGLCFEDEVGNVQLVEPAALAYVLSLAKVDLGLEGVILSACYSEVQAKCIADAVGNVIAMDGTLSDEGAIDFAREFYGALGYGRSFERAFDWALRGIGLTASQIKPRLVKG
jgi:hypothetical protein